MKSDEKKKNICDLKYNTIISYFNAFIVILGSGLITFWITFEPKLEFWLILYIKLQITVGVIFVGFIGWVLFKEKLDCIKDEITKLK